ncbi:hypothetical protein F4677DRAFT_42605 [Hypoxylon crocopeplum]|nr:hypothetical protein F4677DRAFT_42605 [Hypoxylon crocopeplum]
MKKATKKNISCIFPLDGNAAIAIIRTCPFNVASESYNVMQCDAMLKYLGSLKHHFLGTFACMKKDEELGAQNPYPVCWDHDKHEADESQVSKDDPTARHLASSLPASRFLLHSIRPPRVSSGSQDALGFGARTELGRGASSDSNATIAELGLGVSNDDRQTVAVSRLPVRAFSNSLGRHRKKQSGSNPNDPEMRDRCCAERLSCLSARL